MTLWFLTLLSLFAFAESLPTNPLNQTDLQVAMDEMRTSSYYGFVILLKILNSTPNSLHEGEITFLMPNDEELSKVGLKQDNIKDFILSHSIPSELLLSHLLHFPNGTLVPSNVPNRMLRIINSGRSGLFVNNAKLVNPNVCLNSLIRCHGISTAMTFDSATDDLSLLGINRRFKDSLITHRKTKASYVHVKRRPALH